MINRQDAPGDAWLTGRTSTGTFFPRWKHWFRPRLRSPSSVSSWVRSSEQQATNLSSSLFRRVQSALRASIDDRFSLQYHTTYLTSGCFSPTRAGVFYVTRMDGVLDIWDYFYRQNEVAYSHKVGPTVKSSTLPAFGNRSTIRRGQSM